MTDVLPQDDAGATEFVSLVAGKQSFCIKITEIREIRRWTPVTSLPHAEHAVLGVMNLRGTVIPIMDLAAKLGLGSIEPSTRHVIVVVAVQRRTIGLLVDSVSEILTVTNDMVRETPAIRREDATRCIRGLVEVEGDLSRILDLGALLGGEREEAA
jgi:purine-binding chemotaxis protein CheW